MRRLWIVLAVLFACAAVQAADRAEVTEIDLGVCLLDEQLQPTVGKGGGKPPAEGCCDPDLEPGVGGNPLCFEGHICCFDGSWSCRNPDGSAPCKEGNVCDASCGGRGDPCSSDADCCSGNCKGKSCK